MSEIRKSKTTLPSKSTMVSKSNVKEDRITDLAAKIQDTDEMKLKMLAELQTNDPEDLLYPPELNAHLIEQLKIMTGENNELRKCVFEKDQEIKELNKTVSDLNIRIRDILSGTGPALSSKSAGIISAKITELCKQNRHLIAEVECYKTKNASLERKVMKLDMLVKDKEKIEPCLCKDDVNEATELELKDLNSKLNAVNRKLYESKNRNLELKNDILMATKILQQELGDKFTSIKELQCDLAGWRGRAQEISLLKSKIADLEEKLGGKAKDSKKESYNQLVRDLEIKRKKEMDQALRDYEQLKQENMDLKKKLDAAKCRIKNLECDSTTIRQKMQTFAEKSSHDDMLINEQRNEIKTLEVYYQEMLKENTVKMNKMHAEITEYQKLNKNTDEKVEALRKQASEKATKIEELRVQLLRYEECSLQSVFFTPMKTATDNEIKKLSELVVKLNERLDSERHKWDELETAQRKLKEKKKRLEKKVLALEDELKALREESSKRGSKASRTSQGQIDAFLMGTSSRKKMSGSTQAAGDSTSTESTTPEITEQLDKDELKYKLELTEEKLKILEDKLKMTEEEKQEDYNHLTDMIQNSKQLFNEALAVLQKEKCICVS